MSNLAEKGQELKRVTAKLQSLYDKLDTKQIEQRELESKIESYKLKLQRAEKLISALSEEKTRFFFMLPFFLFLINICFLLN